MRNGMPSLTAVAVASARALASTTRAAECDPHDSAALALLPRPIENALGALQASARVLPWLPRALSLASFGLVDHLALRSLVIDRALQAGLARGLEQVVILGAGLDTRAHRLDALRSAHVFEVDHPESQAHKRARAGSVSLQAGELTYVPVDFTRDSLQLELARHEHRADLPTFWIWEGVVPYLERAAIRATLHAVTERSARGSELAATYVTPSLVWMRRARVAVSFGFQSLGEPLRSMIEPDEWNRLLVEAGFELLSDTDTRDWRRELAHDRRVGLSIAYEHLAVARKR
jgi:methyltransferase (TIGR00027 family)